MMMSEDGSNIKKVDSSAPNYSMAFQIAAPQNTFKPKIAASPERERSPDPSPVESEDQEADLEYDYEPE